MTRSEFAQTLHDEANRLLAEGGRMELCVASILSAVAGAVVMGCEMQLMEICVAFSQQCLKAENIKAQVNPQPGQRIAIAFPHGSQN